MERVAWFDIFVPHSSHSPVQLVRFSYLVFSCVTGVLMNGVPDHAMQHFNFHKILNVYSIEPAVVIQTKGTVSDIVDGTGGAQDEWLTDSAMERVAFYEKLKRVHDT